MNVSRSFATRSVSAAASPSMLAVQRRSMAALIAPRVANLGQKSGGLRAATSHYAARSGSALASRSFHASPISRSKDTSWVNKGDVTYKELKPITQAPTGQETIIDVREPDEVQAGIIPSAVNVPLSSFAKAFDKNGGVDFEKQFAFARPGFDDKLIFYCRSGKRSQQALELAQKNGWWNSRNYRGSWLDWVQQEDARKQ